jgi:2-polyprenyl-6-methoxyphenol hydroxylase-like FAD-dependent oxidoreductase
MGKPQKVLVSGASVAGLALAHWLRRAGFDVTVIELAPHIRSGGYPIDLRGAAVDVAERMGLLESLQELHVQTRNVSFVDGNGRLIAAVNAEAVGGSQAGRDLELRRGDLTDALHRLSSDDVEYIFSDSIASLDDHEGGVDVTFEHGAARTFDLVLGADGLHSNVRRLAFGPESTYVHHLGWCFVGFTVPNRVGLSHEVVCANTPGRMAALYAVRDSPELHALLVFARPAPTHEEIRAIEAAPTVIGEAFVGMGGHVPWMLEELEHADDVFADATSQVRMPSWSTGHVAVAGDAAHAASFLSGQGTSLALVGAYVLATALAAAPDHVSAFHAYGERMAPFVKENQALATGNSSVVVATARQLWIRNRLLRALPVLRRLRVTDLLGRAVGRAATAIELPSPPDGA